MSVSLGQVFSCEDRHCFYVGYEPVGCQGAAGVSSGTVIQYFGIAALAMARARSYSHVTKMLLIAAVSGLDAPRVLARRGVLAQSLLFVPGVAYAGIADQLEAASRASEITYSQNGKTSAEINQCVWPAWRYY